MKPITVQTILDVTGGSLCGAPELMNTSIPKIVIDSRRCAGGALYVPIHGARFDGHRFIPSAFENGAALTLSERPLADYPYILVPDALAALQALAAYYRQTFAHVPVIGITGSVGKTSTKEMLYTLLSLRYRVHKNLGNLNNQTGLPQTIFTLEDGYDLSIMELGTNHFGEIERLSYMAAPDVCVFTNIGISHIEFFGSREGIFRGKTEMFLHAREGYRTVVNGDDDLLATLPNALRFGLGKDNDIRAEDVEDLGLNGSRFTLVVKGERMPVAIQSPGRHLVINALAACAVASLYGITPAEMARGLAAYRPEHGRMDVIKTPRFTLIDDSYNAVMDSARSALEALATANTRRVAILGDMRELGDCGESLHEALGRFAASQHIDRILTAGAFSATIAAGARAAGAKNVFSFPDRDAMEASLPSHLQNGDTVLIKASRGLEFEHTVELLRSWN